MLGIPNTVTRWAPSVLASALLLWGFNAPAAQPHPKQHLVDVNSADVQTLETLPGIGPTLAQRLVEDRPYKNLEDLGRVKGMGKTKLEALKDRVTFGPAGPTPKSKRSRSARTAESRTASETTSSGGQTETEVAPAPPTPTGRSAGKLAPGEKLNINTANAEQLARLPGIGPAKAQAIVEYRSQNGEFKSIEDIEKVKGIKGATFSKLKDNIKVTD